MGTLQLTNSLSTSRSSIESPLLFRLDRIDFVSSSPECELKPSKRRFYSISLFFLQGLDNVSSATLRPFNSDINTPRIDSYRFSMANLEGKKPLEPLRSPLSIPIERLYDFLSSYLSPFFDNARG